MNIKIVAIITLLVLLVASISCTNMSKSQQGALSGTAIGAAAGTGIAALAGGNLAVGAAVGGAMLGVAGYIHGNNQQRAADNAKR